MIQEQKTKSNKKSTASEVKALAIKTVILIATVRLAIWFFEIFAAPGLGIRHNHIIIGETMATIAVSFVVVSSIRRLLRRIPTKVPPQFMASMSFFSIIVISLVAALILLYIWDVQIQEILVGGGVAAIVVGIGISTVVGNIFSGALMLTTFPAKIGDSVFVINDNVHGTIEDVSTLYTKIHTENGAKYLVPNSAIIQGNIRIIKEETLSVQLPYSEGDKIEISSDSQRISGMVIKITPSFTTILSDDKKKETTLVNHAITSGEFIITKER